MSSVTTSLMGRRVRGSVGREVPYEHPDGPTTKTLYFVYESEVVAVTSHESSIYLWVIDEDCTLKKIYGVIVLPRDYQGPLR